MNEDLFIKNNPIAIVGGCGHVGLPLGICLANAGFNIQLVDLDEKKVDIINQGQLPFVEEDPASERLIQCVKNKKLQATTNPAIVSDAKIIIFVTGTPVDEHLNPRIQDVANVVMQYLPYIKSTDLVILRSTVYPGTVEYIDQIMQEHLDDHCLAFCPERIAQGLGMSEIAQLPQIISGTSKKAVEMSRQLFQYLACKVIELAPMEAELAKLITNSWRYIEFAITNQFYMMVEQYGIDFYKIFQAIKEDYPRTRSYASPGLSAGPCLFKDTMQLSAFHKSNFFLGHSAMLINEGLPVFLVEKLEKTMGTLKGKKILILGMTFKANNDDIRESLSFKLKKILETKLAKVLTSDIYLPKTLPLNEALERAEGIILATPHREYKELRPSCPYVDCWGIWR